jgi:hypothetical protein
MTLNVGADGTLGIIVNPHTRNHVQVTALVVGPPTDADYANWTVLGQVEPFATGTPGISRVRCVGMCAALNYMGKDTDKPGVIYDHCGTGILAADRTAATSLASLVKGLNQADGISNPEYGWCPQGVKSFGYCLPGTAWSGTLTEDSGGLAYETKPSIHIQIVDATPGLTYELVTTILLEGVPTKDAAGSLIRRYPGSSNRTALDIVMNAVHQVNWRRVKKTTLEISGYAARVALALGAPEVAAGIAIGRAWLQKIMF